MKANKFVKKYGWDYVEHILTDDAPLVMDLDYADLNRLVKSHKLVECYGGLESSKLIVNYPNFLNDEDIKTTSYRLSKAIADVESCL